MLAALIWLISSSTVFILTPPCAGLQFSYAPSRFTSARTSTSIIDDRLRPLDSHSLASRLIHSLDRVIDVFFFITPLVVQVTPSNGKAPQHLCRKTRRLLLELLSANSAMHCTKTPFLFRSKDGEDTIKPMTRLLALFLSVATP